MDAKRLEIHPSPGIQLYRAANCLFSCKNDAVTFYVGLDTPLIRNLKDIITKHLLSLSNSKNTILIRVVGPTKSGRSTLVRNVIPTLVPLEYRHLIVIYDDVTPNISLHVGTSEIIVATSQTSNENFGVSDEKRRKTFDEIDEHEVEIQDLSTPVCAEELADLQLLMRHFLGADKFVLKELLLLLGQNGAYLPVDPSKTVITLQDVALIEKMEIRRNLHPARIMAIYGSLIERFKQEKDILALLSQNHCLEASDSWSTKEWENRRSAVSQAIRDELFKLKRTI